MKQIFDFDYLNFRVDWGSTEPRMTLTRTESSPNSRLCASGIEFTIRTTRRWVTYSACAGRKETHTEYQSNGPAC